MLIWFQYFSNDCSVPPQINNQQPTRLSDDAVPAKDTESWQAGLDQNLPGIPSANYITKSMNDASDNVTKVWSIFFEIGTCRENSISDYYPKNCNLLYVTLGYHIIKWVTCSHGS